MVAANGGSPVGERVECGHNGTCWRTWVATWIYRTRLRSVVGSPWHLPWNMGCDRGEINMVTNLVNCRSSRPAAVFTNVEIVQSENRNLLKKSRDFYKYILTPKCIACILKIKILACNFEKDFQNRFRVIFGTKKPASSDTVIIPPRNIVLCELDSY